MPSQFAFSVWTTPDYFLFTAARRGSDYCKLKAFKHRQTSRYGKQNVEHAFGSYAGNFTDACLACGLLLAYDNQSLVRKIIVILSYCDVLFHSSLGQWRRDGLIYTPLVIQVLVFYPIVSSETPL
eukprot:6209556-Pleurochrysis_carterae.AAC.2